MKMPNAERRIQVACVLALVALALIMYSLVVPKPMPVIVAMSVAQGMGTLSLLIFLHVVVADLWNGMKTTDRPDEQPPVG